MTTLTDGRAVQVAEYGARGGAAVLWLHGAASSRLEAAGLDEAAAAAGVRIIAPDRPGVGGSDPVAGLTVASYADDLAQLLDSLQLEQAVVAGLSNGGMFALGMGALRPDRVVKVVAVNPASPIFDPAVLAALPRSARARYGLLAKKPELVTRAAAGKEPGALMRFAMRRLDPDAALMQEPTHAERVKANRAELQRQPDAGYLVNEVKLALGRWGFDHRAVPVPVVLFSGEKDAGLAYAKIWADELPDGTLETFPGGHLGLFRPENTRRVVASLRSGAA